MAKQTVVRLIDDLDGKEIDDKGSTVTFALLGVTYEIDLSEKNAQKLHDSLAPYIAHARRVGGRQARGTATTAKTDTARIKEWADSQGLDYPRRGRLPQTLIEAYKSAN